MRYPAQLYAESPRPYRGLSELAYPLHHRTVTVTHCGRVCFGRRKINLSTVSAGQNVGAKQVDQRIFLVSFMQYDWGSSMTRHVAWNRRRTRSRRKCYPCLRYKPSPM
jgi:putative transposase